MQLTFTFPFFLIALQSPRHPFLIFHFLPSALLAPNVYSKITNLGEKKRDKGTKTHALRALR